MTPSEKTSDTSTKRSTNGWAQTAVPLTYEPWSTILQSPSDLASFSPSMDLGTGNLHGFGLQLATERTKAVGKFGRRTAAYLRDIANTYDTFGHMLMKASHVIHPDVWKISENDIVKNAFPSKDIKTTQPCYDTVRDFGMTSKRLAEYYRTRLVAPLKTTLSANRTAVETHGQRYVAARTQCLETRSRALTARAKYVKAVRGVEKAFCKWKKARRCALLKSEDIVGKESSSLSASPLWEQAIWQYGNFVPSETNLLIKKIHDADTAKLRYQELVENENDAVTYAQKMEAMALDAIQEVETARVNFFLQSVVQPLCAANALNVQKLPMPPENIDMKPATEEASSLDLKRGKDLLANIFIRQNISYEEGMGLTDAETLGLPLVMGNLRDDVKKKVANIAESIKAADILLRFLDEFGSAIITLEAGLKIDSMPTNAQQQSISELASSSIGRTAAVMWEGVVKMYEDEAAIAGEVAAAVSRLRLQKLDVFMETAQKDLKAEKDYDDTNWKTLCDVARTESKAAARYRQMRAQQEKARERMLSVDPSKGGEGVEEQSTAQKNRMSKALFAGGEAMKKFQENARLAIAKSNLTDAEQNAAKEQQSLDEASAMKSQAIADYKRVTQARIEKLESINKSVQRDFEKIREAIINGIGRLHKAREDGLVAPVEEGNLTSDRLMKDVDDWVQTARDRIEANRKTAEIDETGQRNGTFGEGFRLPLALVESEELSKLLSLKDPTSPPPDFISNVDGAMSAESSEDELDISAVDSFESNGTLTATNTLSINVPSEAGTESNERVSLSMPTTPTGSTQETSEERIDRQHAQSNFEGTSDINDEEQDSHDLHVFMRQFWDGQEGMDKAPEILEIVNCSYRPKVKGGFLIPTLHGRLYTTAEKLYFLALDGKKFVLSLEDVVGVTREKGFMGGSDRAVVMTYKTTGGESAFVLSRLASRDTFIEHLRRLLTGSQARKAPPHTEIQPDEEALPPVPEDETLKKMTIVLSKPIRGVSVKEVYAKAWSEGDGTSERPFYGPWLEEEECFNIIVGDWEFAASGSEPFIGPWDKERYTMRRFCTFKFKRTTHLYIGPPIAFVKQTHYCRVEGDDKCIVCISASMEGIPYADTFVVEMRWVARRLGSNDLDVKVGLEVDFKKSSMLKNQIRSGTLTETTNVHFRMFDAIKRVCRAGGGNISDVTIADSATEREEQEVAVEKGKEEPMEHTSLLSQFLGILTAIPINPNFLLFASATLAYPVLWNFFSSFFGAPAISMSEAHRLNVQIQELRQEVRDLKSSLDTAVRLLRQQE